MDGESLITGDQPVLIRLPNGEMKISRLSIGGHCVSEIRLGKLRVPSMSRKSISLSYFVGKALLGHPYGATFTHETGSRWSRSQRTELRGAIVSDNENNDSDIEACDSVIAGKHEGHVRATDSAINNAAFLSKSNFSQEKYLRKKHDKYAKEITVLKPSLADFCESCPTEIRSDLLGSLLRFSAAKYGDSVGVIDDTAGILVTALLQRGCSVERYVCGRNTGQEKALHMFGQEKAPGLTVIRQESLASSGTKYDSIVLAHNGTTDVDLDVAYRVLEPMLKHGGALAIYSRTIEPLLEILYNLRNVSEEESASSKFINIQLTEQMYREQEIVKERTHPIMQQSTNLFQGFILSAIKVAPNTDTSLDSNLSH